MGARLGIWKVMVGLWLFVMMALPDTASWIKLGLLLMLAVYALARGGWNYNRRFLVAVVIWELLFGLFYLNAAAGHFGFSFTLFEIYFLRPLFLLILCKYSGTEEMVHAIRKALLLTALFIEAYNIVFFLQMFQVLPEILGENAAVTVIINDDFLTMRVSNQTALIFLVPYLSFLFFRKDGFCRRERKSISVLFWVGMLVAVLSGRRILQMLSIGCFLINGMGTWKRKATARKFTKIICMVFAALMAVAVLFAVFHKAFGFNVFTAVSRTISNAFDQSDFAGRIRMKQFELLMKDWLKRPLWGWGLSAYNREYYVYKSHLLNRPESNGDLWSYEFFYVALLFQIGLIGMAFILRVIYKILKEVAYFLRQGQDERLAVEIKAVLCGSVAFFIAGFTNPMITGIWFWFLLLSVYCYALKMNGVRKGMLAVGCRKATDAERLWRGRKAADAEGSGGQ